MAVAVLVVVGIAVLVELVMAVAVAGGMMDAATKIAKDSTIRITSCGFQLGDEESWTMAAFML